MTILRVIDFETTGVDDPCSVVEAAYYDYDPERRVPAGGWSSLVVPQHPIDVRARAVHHISYEEASDIGISWDCAVRKLEDCDDDVIYVAHNADFERRFFNPEGSKWICTYKCALRAWPDAPGHGNQVLRYWLGLDIGDEAMPPHRAMPDCIVTSAILYRLLSGAESANHLMRWTEQPPYLTKIGFGKHRGELFSDLPTDYLRWIIRQDMDEGVLAAANRELFVRSTT